MRVVFVFFQNIAQIPRRLWPFTTARQAMVPVDRIDSISPYMELMEAIREMEQRQVNQVPVMFERRLVGMLNRDDVMRYLRLRSELRI